MRTPHWRRVARVLLGVVLFALPASAHATVECSLFLDSRGGLLLRSDYVRQAFAAHAQRIIVPVFDGGHVVFHSAKATFPQMDGYCGKPDVFASLLTRAHKRGLRVYAYFNLLHWREPQSQYATDAFESRVELADRDIAGQFGSASDGAYASPFDPRVKALLCALAEETAQRYPTLDGVLIGSSFPSNWLLGYSDADRASYIRDAQIDPIDIGNQFGADEARATYAWMSWREKHMCQLVESVASTFRRCMKNCNIAILGDAGWYSESLDRRNLSLDDWLDWARLTGADEMVLDGDWESLSDKGVFSSAVQLKARYDPAAKLSMLLDVHEGYAPGNPITEIEMQQDTLSTSLVLRPKTANDLAYARSFVSTLLPRIEESQR